jgi:hypothetical protein
MYRRIWELLGSRKLSSSTVTELDDNLPHFTDDRRDSVRATHGLPSEVFVWKTTLGWGRTWPKSLIVIMKGGHSCCLHGSHVSCCQVISLARWLLIQISMTPSYMCEACSLHPNIEDKNNVIDCYEDSWIALAILYSWHDVISFITWVIFACLA